VTYFWNFGTPSLSRERIKLETSKSARRLINRATNDKNKKIRSKGVLKRLHDLLLEIEASSKRVNVTYYLNFEAPSISPDRFEQETSNLAHRMTTRGTNEENQKLGQRGS